VFTCYVDGYGFNDGVTVKESIEMLKSKMMKPKEILIPEVDISI
jgi:hypothetical protein